MTWKVTKGMTWERLWVDYMRNDIYGIYFVNVWFTYTRVTKAHNYIYKNENLASIKIISLQIMEQFGNDVIVRL